MLFRSLIFGGGLTGGAGVAKGEGVFAAGAGMDVEVALGNRWDWFGISVALRPTCFAGYELFMFYVPLELVFAFYLGEQWGITLAGNGGINMGTDYVYGGGGFALGIFGHL